MIVVAAHERDAASVMARLTELGSRSMQVVPALGARRLVLAAGDDEWAEERIVAALRSDGLLAVTRPDDGPRLDAWMRHTQPITFGSRLSVCFAWSEHDRSRLSGLVELGLGGFGNGEHDTTRMLIEQMLARLVGGERVLDVGCGSGVLGLCALRLGAAHVVAMDMKAEAVDATRRNASLNGLAQQMEATFAPLTVLGGPFDVIVANVGRSAIVELAPELVRLLSPRGWLAVSGISPPQCSLVSGFLRPLVQIEQRTTAEWATVVLAKDASRRRGSEM